MASTPKLQDCERVLVVEGYGDLLFFAEALEWIGIEGVFIQPMGGKSNLTITSKGTHPTVKTTERTQLQTLETFLSPRLLEQKKAIAVIVDADAGSSGTARSLEACLKRITGQEVRAGDWTEGPPRVGLFVVPGDGREGELESLVWESWANDPANADPRACVESYLKCMGSLEKHAKSPDKGKIGALLSVLYDEDPRLGPGARARVFDLERIELAPLLAFLRGFNDKTQDDRPTSPTA